MVGIGSIATFLGERVLEGIHFVGTGFCSWMDDDDVGWDCIVSFVLILECTASSHSTPARSSWQLFIGEICQCYHKAVETRHPNLRDQHGSARPRLHSSSNPYSNVVEQSITAICWLGKVAPYGYGDRPAEVKVGLGLARSLLSGNVRQLIWYLPLVVPRAPGDGLHLSLCDDRCHFNQLPLVWLRYHRCGIIHCFRWGEPRFIYLHLDLDRAASEMKKYKW
jgi:hypothetical protein